MKSLESSQDFFAESKPVEGPSLDLKRVLYSVFRYWYIVVLSLMITLTAAFLHNRYATRIYPVTASIIIKEAGDISGGELLYSNPLVDFKRNYVNELYIIKSYPLIQSVLEELNFGVSFYREGNFLTTEAYDYIPVEAIVLGKDANNINGVFKILDEHSFELKRSEDVRENEIIKFHYGDTVTFNGVRLIFKRKASRKLEPYQNVSFIFNYTPPLNLAGSYIAKLNADWAEEGAGVINLNIKSLNPVKDKDFLEGLIRLYQDYDLQKKNLTASRTVDFISDQLDGISDSLRHVENQLERFKDENVVTDLTGEALRLYQKLEELETQKGNAIISSNYYDYLINYIQQNENLDQVILPTSVGISDPVLTGLVSKMVDMQLELKLISQPEHPLVIDAKKTISEIKKDIIESIKNLRSTDKIKQNYISKQIQTVEKQLEYLPVTERRFVSIQRNYTLLENLYIFLLQKRSEAAISKAASASDIVVVNPPRVAGAPISPKVSQNYLVGALLGLGLPILTFVLMELFNSRVQSYEDIKKITPIPFVGGIGHKRTENNLEVLTNPKTSIAESFRALRSNLNYFIGKQQKVVLLITSSISGEGKTFTSINLASVLALSGKRTLIVGADMRKPKIFGDFGLTNDVGLSSYLAGIVEFDTLIQKTSNAYLDLISGGPVPPNPSELLLTGQMQVFITEAKKKYDCIIIDTPPLAIVTDAFALTEHVDHTIFVVRQNYTPKQLLRTVQEFYTSGKLKNISLLLNDIYKSGPGYGYGPGYLDSDYDYYTDNGKN